MSKRKDPKDKKMAGAPTSYQPEYAEQIVDFFSEPHYLVKDMTITKSDGTQIDKTEFEPLPPVFLSGFAKQIGISRVGYRQTFSEWGKKYPLFGDALKEAKELMVERVRVNASLGLYPAAFAIFTLKNITTGMKQITDLDTGEWRDRQEVSGPGGGPLEVKNIDLSKANVDELLKYLQAKTR